MPPTLYCLHASPPVRAVLITLKAIGLQVEEIETNLLTNDHLTEKFKQINPQHTIPTLVDEDGFTIWDSHAIVIYLLSKYPNDNKLYPSDIRQQAVVNQRLHFDSGILFPRLRKAAEPIIFWGKTAIDQEDTDKIVEAYTLLESLFCGEWVAGSVLTIADYCLISSVSSMDKMVKIDKEKFPKIIAWIERCEKLPAYEANLKGLKQFEDLILKGIGQQATC